MSGWGKESCHKPKERSEREKKKTDPFLALERSLATKDAFKGGFDISIGKRGEKKLANVIL